MEGAGEAIQAAAGAGVLAERSQRSSVSSVGARPLDVLVYLANDVAVQLTVDNLPSVTVQELHQVVRESLQLSECALEVFSLWLISPLLEVQLKPKHQPYKVCRQWQDLLFRFTNCPEEEFIQDEPSLQFRRNVFFPKRKELQIEDEAVLRLLYEEAKFNILEGRYPCDVEDCEQLGALVCRVSLGPYDQDQHTASTLKEKLDSYLPAHLCKRSYGLFTALRNRGAKPPPYEQALLQAYRDVREEAACEEPVALWAHYRTYLQKCHELPYYGCAFFSGEIEKPAQGFLQRGGRKLVSVAISLEGVYVVDSKEKHLLLGLRFQELSWEHTRPDEEEEEEEHILWLEFDGESEGTPVNKLLKVYSKQAELMSGLIEFCIELNAATEAAAATESASAAGPGRSPAEKRRPKLRRQHSVICNRIQQLATIDYVDNGKEIKRVKPKRTASFFGRQLSHSPTTYSAMQTAESLEQG